MILKACLSCFQQSDLTQSPGLRKLNLSGHDNADLGFQQSDLTQSPGREIETFARKGNDRFPTKRLNPVAGTKIEYTQMSDKHLKVSNKAT